LIDRYSIVSGAGSVSAWTAPRVTWWVSWTHRELPCVAQLTVNCHVSSEALIAADCLTHSWLIAELADGLPVVGICPLDVLSLLLY